MTMGSSTAARLNIHVNDDCGKTVSKFGVDSEGVVEFINDHGTKTLTVSIQTDPGNGTALQCDDEPIATFTVTPSGKRAFRIPRNFTAESFKYTATLEGSEPEDPIIIIERR